MLAGWVANWGFDHSRKEKNQSLGFREASFVKRHLPSLGPLRPLLTPGGSSEPVGTDCRGDHAQVTHILATGMYTEALGSWPTLETERATHFRLQLELWGCPKLHMGASLNSVQFYS
jgi:hypothetical protein